jgi:AbrB family looped-hinge helix DNA binding protein
MLYCECKEFKEVADMDIARVTSKGQITVPIDVRRKLGLTEGARLLFIEQGNGFFVANESRIDMTGISGATGMEAHKKQWPEEYVTAIMAFGETPDPTFEEHADTPWTDRGDLF